MSGDRMWLSPRRERGKKLRDDSSNFVGKDEKSVVLDCLTIGDDSSVNEHRLCELFVRWFYRKKVEFLGLGRLHRANRRVNRWSIKKLQDRLANVELSRGGGTRFSGFFSVRSRVGLRGEAWCEAGARNRSSSLTAGLTRSSCFGQPTSGQCNDQGFLSTSGLCLHLSRASLHPKPIIKSFIGS